MFLVFGVFNPLKAKILADLKTGSLSCFSFACQGMMEYDVNPLLEKVFTMDNLVLPNNSPLLKIPVFGSGYFWENLVCLRRGST